jgi:hypothetical protein
MFADSNKIANGNITLKSNDLKTKKVIEAAIKKPRSPILFISIALIEDLLACTLVFQKLINKKEHKPIPSQPKKSCTKLSLVTKINIKKVNKDKYDKKRI